MTKEVRVQMLGEDFERVYCEERAQSDRPAKVEIVTNGVHKLLFVNGQRINRVLDIELPVKVDEVSPQIVVKLWADEIIQRRVEGAEYKRLAGA